ncbi:MAG: hypothetical protein JW870_02730 [Candidatus Delongbacteria bacterium]|nr:hypothetical protein [Candidatus Delongbacteria bacterium]
MQEKISHFVRYDNYLKGQTAEPIVSEGTVFRELGTDFDLSFPSSIPCS